MKAVLNTPEQMSVTLTGTRQEFEIICALLNLPDHALENHGIKFHDVEGKDLTWQMWEEFRKLLEQ